MANTMQLSNGEIVIIQSGRDFEDILDKYLGFEAARYFRELYDDYYSIAGDYDEKCEECVGLNDAKIDLENRVSELEHQIEDLEAKVEDLEWELDYEKDNYKELENEYEEYRLENPRSRFF